MNWSFWGKVAVIVAMIALVVWLFWPARRRSASPIVKGGGGSTSEPITGTGDGSVSPRPKRPRAE